MDSISFDWNSEIDWSVQGSNNTERLNSDKFKRSIYAEFLTRYLSSEGESNSYVLNLNAEWGAGKTWFIKRWHSELKNIYPTVYIDAWQQDFSDDPLLTVFSSIVEQLKYISGNEIKIAPEFKEKIFKLLKGTGKFAIKSAMNSVGIKLDDIDLTLDSGDVDGFVDALCSTHKERYDAIQSIKNDIREWIDACRGKTNLRLPAFILIDELDRCRPSYAVEMLETIKHIFDIPGIVFVIATDTEQLQHAIKAIYGEGFDARSYLGRFFRRRFSLHEASRQEFILDRIVRIKEQLLLDNVWPQYVCSGDVGIKQLANILYVTSDTFGLSLRRTEQLMDRVIAILTHNKAVEPRLNLVVLIFLCAIHDKYHDVYVDLINERMALDSGSKSRNLSSWLSEFPNLDLEVNLVPEEALGSDIKDSLIQSYDNRMHLSINVRNPFKNGGYTVSYQRLVLSLINSTYIKPDMHYEHERMYKIVSGGQSRGPIGADVILALVRYEQGFNYTDIDYYRSFVELATRLD